MTASEIPLPKTLSNLNSKKAREFVLFLFVETITLPNDLASNPE